LGRIVHDERGAGSVEWHNAPEDYSRPVLEVDDPLGSSRNAKVRGGIEVLHIKNDETFDPYARLPGDRGKSSTAKRDLRKLSEHIKLMRELEERRKKGDDK